MHKRDRHRSLSSLCCFPNSSHSLTLCRPLTSKYLFLVFESVHQKKRKTIVCIFLQTGLHTDSLSQGRTCFLLCGHIWRSFTHADMMDCFLQNKIHDDGGSLSISERGFSKQFKTRQERIHNRLFWELQPPQLLKKSKIIKHLSTYLHKIQSNIKRGCFYYSFLFHVTSRY